MVRWRSGTVTTVRRQWTGATELEVRLADGTPMRALAYPHLVGHPEPGDRVLLNAAALLMGLGTGGYALVVALPDRLPADPPQVVDSRDAGHLVKARYTPLQPILLGVDEEASPHREVLAAADSLDGMPVVTADLHSALPAVLAGIRADAPDARVAYLLTDGGALPAWFSRTLDGLRDHLVGTVSVGQAFGGDLEAATLHTGLLAARHVLHADVAIVAQGPGNLGTGTRWGFSGVAVGEAVNAVAVLGGWAVGSLRISDADPRPRHQGVSHHSLTAYGRVALAPADLVVPEGLEPALAAQVDAALAGLTDRHHVVRVHTDGLDAALRAVPVTLSTMGRGLDADHAYFLAAAAAGRHAVGLLG
ncbi:DUF3866 family protein [Micromonospora sp. NPDC000207]|uniref:DUF3866 family protein n=1 Tax=Micromonospora sp. NPDC000207 TaxID=3154246 RepID=UPI00332E7EE5